MSDTALAPLDGDKVPEPDPPNAPQAAASKAAPDTAVPARKFRLVTALAARSGTL
jgi:hypothetical protein